MKKTQVKKAFRSIGSLFLAGVMSLSVMTGSAVTADYEDDIAELQRKQAELAEEREALEASLGEYEQNAEEHEKYLEIYDEKMKLQEQEIQNIKEQISLLNDDIAELEKQIAVKEDEVAEGIEEFKARLRAMYMNGNDSIASMLAGSTDFYDILARTELMERMSRHDNEMIDKLNEKITALNNDKAALEESKAQTEQKKAEAEGVLTELQATYADHQQTKEYYEAKAEYSRNRTQEIKDEQAAAEEELQEFIRKQQEELERKREEERRRKEEEERKRREEEERKRKEEEERRRQEEERRRQEAEAQGIEYVPEPVVTEPEPEPEDTNQYVTGASEGFIWPCPTVLNMTDVYGYRTIAEEGGASDFHKGIDINKPNCAGEPIVASASGTVITASNTGNGYGIHVVIDHGDKIATLYAHMSSCCVSVGDEVSQGQTIGYIGCTGYAYGNHCHFEVRVNGQHTDPQKYVSI